MTELLLVILTGLTLTGVIMLVVLLTRGSDTRLSLERTERVIKEEMARNREEATSNARLVREEVSSSFKSLSDSLLARITETATLQKNQLEAFAQQLSTLTQLNEHKLENIRETVEERLRHLQAENNQMLEQMRATVDEKLQSTLEKRLGESFRLVSERLEQVYKGLGEMQNIASSVGDLKKVLSNVKTRGILGEIQLENLLEQVLTAEQYVKNVATRKGSGDRVEFAIKLPARDGTDRVVWLPIDAKFPMEDYQRLLEAQEQVNPALVEEMGKLLENRLKIEAKSIRDKYLDPPNTTDFGILFLPVEGLYAEILRRPGLCDALQREYRVIVTGPTTLAALLNSLQMGFRTLAIEKRSSEVWTLLGTVKTEFGKFGLILEKTQKKLQEASNTIEDAAVRSRAIERKLKDVQELPSYENTGLLEKSEGL